jgi:hypothetical protein
VNGCDGEEKPVDLMVLSFEPHEHTLYHLEDCSKTKTKTKTKNQIPALNQGASESLGGG